MNNCFLLHSVRPDDFSTSNLWIRLRDLAFLGLQNIRLLVDDRTGERILHLFVVRVVAIFLIFLLCGSSSGTAIVGALRLGRRNLIIRLVEGLFFYIFCTRKVLLHLFRVNFFQFLILFDFYHVLENV